MFNDAFILAWLSISQHIFNNYLMIMIQLSKLDWLPLDN